MQTISIVIMAAGDSTRFVEKGARRGVKKQWLRINNTPLWLSVTRKLFDIFLNITQSSVSKNLDLANLVLDKIYITSHPSDLFFMRKYAPKSLYFGNKSYSLEIVEGGDSRFKSLSNVINITTSHYLLVHDSARDVDDIVVQDMLAALNGFECDCIVPVLKISDSVLMLGEKISHMDREKLRIIQTPQISRLQKLKESLGLNIDFNDESAAVNALGGNIKFVEGSKKSYKITYQSDVAKYFQDGNTDIYTGFGTDVHSFEEGRVLKIGGIEIESSFGFKAHSDGDVVLHALVDALLGAASFGDIGELYPDSDASFKNIDSNILLKDTYDKILSLGLELINVDVAITAQIPKISPYKDSIKENLSNILCLDVHKINIKASTPEKLGSLGRSEGVLAQVIVNLKSREV